MLVRPQVDCCSRSHCSGKNLALPRVNVDDFAIKENVSGWLVNNMGMEQLR